MKKLFTFIMAIWMIGMMSNTSVAQTPPNWEDLVVDMFVWGTANANIPADDTIWYESLIGNPEYNGYLPIVIEYPDIAEFYDIETKESVGFSKLIRLNDVCQMAAIIAGTNQTEVFGGICVYEAYTRPAQMRPFTDTIYVEEGKKYTLNAWHWVYYEEPYINPWEWEKNGEFLDGYLGMKKIDIYGPTTGDTVVYTVCVRDSRAGINITNTFIIIGIPKSDFGVDDNVVNNVSIYPNPSNDGFITIKGEGIAKIFNILGQEIKSVEVNEGTKIFLNSGMYIIQMGNLTKKVVVR